MSLTSSEAKSIIDSLFRARTIEHVNTQTLAYTLESFITDTLSGDKYIGELLQNADDAGSKEVSFILVDDYLIFKHSGKHFDKDDIIAISDSAKPDRYKVERSDQIGNKGIGFKSVFSLASEVSILSKKVCFRFDEHHEHWRGHPEDYPWQIIPIYTKLSDFPSSVQQQYSKESVNFIFKLRPHLMGEIKEHLKKLSSCHFLFLRNLKKCSILSGEEKRSFHLQKPEIQKIYFDENHDEDSDENEGDEFLVEKISVNKERAWWVYRKECNLPQSLMQQLAQAKNIPKKYKDWSSIPISIAVLEVKGVLVALSNMPTIFCYLATNLNFNTKFAFNAEFLLDSARMQLCQSNIANAWNGFILQCMIKEHINFLSLLSLRTPLWRNIFQILSPDYNVPDAFLDACKKSFKDAIEQNFLVSNMLDETVLTCQQTTIDIYGFIQHFGAKELKKNVAHPEMENSALILKLGAKRFQSIDILKCFEEEWLLKSIQDPEKNRDFILMMTKIAAGLKEDARNKFEMGFKSASLILDIKGELRKPSEVHFPDKTLKYATKDFDFIVSVHPIIAAMDRQWLMKIGVKTLTFKKVIYLVNKAESSLVQFLISLATSQRTFSNDEWECIKELKIITADGQSVTAAEVYLPNVFSPHILLQKFFPSETALFCHPSYALDQSEADIKKIRDFLIKVGVQDSLRKSLLEKIITIANQNCSKKQLIALTQLLYRHYFSKKAPSYSTVDILQTLNVVCIDGQIRTATETYLSDYYEPKTPLQKIIPDVHFISEKYYMSDMDLDNVANFFVTIGVKQTITLTLHEAPYRETLVKNIPDSKDYFSYLERTNPNLYSSATRSYMHQHRLDGFYIEISFAHKLLEHDFFWEVLTLHWEKIQRAIVRTKYRTQRDNTPIISNIHYLVILAVEKRCGKHAKPEQFFCQAFADKLSGFFEDFQVAQVTRPLSIQQCADLGFRTIATVKETQDLLKRIAFANHGQRDFSKIVFLYQNLILALDQEDKSILQPDCLLLARDNHFRIVSELYYIIDDSLPESRSPKLIKKPKTISEEDFCQLCDFFEIRCLEPSELKIRLTRKIDSTISALIVDRLDFCIYTIAQEKDLSGELLQKEHAKLKPIMKDRLQSLQFICAETIEVYYNDVLNEAQDCWIDRESRTIYHLPYEKLNQQSRNALFMFCCVVLDLVEQQETILSIMTSPISRLEQKYADEISQCLEESVASERSDSYESRPVLKRKLRSVVNASSSEEDTSNESDGKEEKIEHEDETLPMQLEKTPGSFSHSYWSSLNENTLQSKKPRQNESNVSSAASSIASMSLSISRQGGFFTERFNKEQRKELGRKGEESVYNFLKEKHIKKHGAAAITDTENNSGYVIQKPNGDIKMIQWLNKNSEQYKPYDFEITVKKTNGQSKLRHLEVKTSTSLDNEIEVIYSINEWQQMKKDEQENRSHRLFIVRAVIDDACNATFSEPIKMNLLANEDIKVTHMKKLTIRL